MSLDVVSNLEPSINWETNDWDSLLDEITTTNIIPTINFDHKKILDEIQESSALSPINLEKKLTFDYSDYKICPLCQIECKIQDASIVCEKCGMEKKWQSDFNEGYSSTIDQNYNTSNNSYVSFNIVGPKAYRYRRAFLRACSNHTMYRNNSNRKEFNSIIFNYKGNKPPSNIIHAAADLFDTIVRSGFVCRKNGKRGVMAACLYYACKMRGVTRTPKDIAAIMDTEEKFVSQGDRVLLELNELGIISIPTAREPIDDYLNQFFPALDIPEKYKEFINDLINTAEKHHLHVKNECRTTTKCVGAIYLLTQRVNELKHIDKDTISAKCNNISQTTFVKYYTLLINNPTKVKSCFKRHGITMPLAWKNL